ncbi:fibronectin type III domain-containing protein, partial [Butyricicoccus sp. 1XD8-22]
MAAVTLGSKAVGSIVKIKVSGTLRNFIVVHQGKPSSIYDASCDGTWLLMEDIYEYRQWHSSNVNDYADSTIHPYLNSTFLNRIDANIRPHIKRVKIPYRPGSGTGQTVNSGVSGLSVKIFLLSDREVGYTQSNADRYIVNDGAKLSYFQDGNGTAEKIAKLNGIADLWWLRSSHTSSSTDTWYVGSTGRASSRKSSNACGVRPALILSSTLLVSDDGTFNINTAPTTPGSINIPDKINGGNTITVSWGASTDAEGNLEGYIVERSVDGGSVWKQIYQGSGRSTTNTVAFGTASVMYRVKAYDTEGLQSGWRTSQQITVLNNNAPSAPGSIAVPEMVNAGQAFVVTWSAASDSDGDLAGYSLERQLNGGSWAEVYNGVALAYTETLEKGWNTVAYRVRAYDAHTAYSGYATSPTRTVNNNSAPMISGQDAALGLKTGSFSQSYTVTDAENDTVTVTEFVDQIQLRSYTAALGQAQAVTVPHKAWLTLANGNHQLRIEASDGNAAAVRVWTFSKKETVICFQLAAPEETDAAAAKVLISPTWNVTGAKVKIEACNNAFDAAPAWEDITAMVLLNRVYNFQNKAKTAGK